MNINGGNIMTTNAPADRLLEKVMEAISEQATTNAEKEENGQTKCPHHFRYLSELPKNASIPEECLLCPKVVDCIVSS